MIDPIDLSIGDVIRVAFGNPLDALAKADIGLEAEEPAIAEQVRVPTTNELAEIEELAQAAGRLQDEVKAEAGDKPQRLRSLKNQLKEKMIRFGLKQVVINGRPPIELTESSSRKPTQKAIIGVLEAAAVKRLTEEERRDAKQLKKAKAEGKTKALNLWNAIETSTSHSVKIPDPSPPEIDSPY